MDGLLHEVFWAGEELERVPAVNNPSSCLSEAALAPPLLLGRTSNGRCQQAEGEPQSDKCFSAPGALQALAELAVPAALFPELIGEGVGEP